RRERQPDLADDLRVHVQRVAGVTPVVVRQRGPLVHGLTLARRLAARPCYPVKVGLATTGTAAAAAPAVAPAPNPAAAGSGGLAGIAGPPGPSPGPAPGLPAAPPT